MFAYVGLTVMPSLNAFRHGCRTQGSRSGMVARPKSIESGKVACKTPVKNTLKKKQEEVRQLENKRKER